MKSVDVVEITVEMAKELLKGNTENRKLRKKTVTFYAKQMKSGNWEVTHQGIAIATSGRLLDGQHRLHAIIEADVPVKMMVYVYENEDVFKKIDIGATRSTSDITGIKGMSVATVKKICLIGSDVRTAVSINEVENAYYRHKEIIECVDNCDTSKGYDAGIRAGVVLYLYYSGFTEVNKMKVKAINAYLRHGVCDESIGEGVKKLLHKIVTSSVAIRTNVPTTIEMFWGLVKSTKKITVSEVEHDVFKQVAKEFLM